MSIGRDLMLEYSSGVNRSPVSRGGCFMPPLVSYSESGFLPARKARMTRSHVHRPAASLPSPLSRGRAEAHGPTLTNSALTEMIARSTEAPRPLQGGSAVGIIARLAETMAAGTAVAPQVTAGIQGAASGGQVLPSAPRARLEESFGTDLEGVRVHTDARADHLARDLQARAFTAGSDIFFRGGTWEPDTEPGYRLLAHEVAHTQQSAVPSGGMTTPGDAREQEAERAADRAAAGLPVGFPAGGGGAEIARDEDERATTQERSAERGQEELDRRTPESDQLSDGSGEWGREEPGMTDQANRMFWYSVATAAEGIGLVNAARHMRHYLDNSGAELSVSVNTMLRDSPTLEEQFLEAIETAKVDAERMLEGADLTADMEFALAGERKGHYFNKGESEDWFFAVGGCGHWFTAEVFYYGAEDPAERQLSMSIKLHVSDNYNWDEGKQVEIMGMVIKDEQLGRLHVVGLAKEYPVLGTSSARDVEWQLGTAAGPGAPSTYVRGRGDQAGEREGQRSDTDRAR
jgi:hypothetical protein